MFFGYYLSILNMVRDEDGPPVPELARRMTASGIKLGDLIDDSGYAHRDAGAWAIPLRQAGAQPVQDLHPADRAPRGTHHGAVIANGNLYCPCTPKPLLELGPLPPGAPAEQVPGHDQQTAELARYKPGRHTADGYHRASCPATAGKIRCPLRPDSMLLSRDRPEIPAPPEHPPACCTQRTITVPPPVAAKTRHKHHYPSAAWQWSYRRRTSAERANATIKDTASNNIARGWIRLMGLTPLTLWIACPLAVRNQHIPDSYQARQQDHQRRAAVGLPPRTRKRRRTTLAALAAAPP